MVRVDSRPAVGQALLTLGLQKWASLLESIAHESEEKKRRLPGARVSLRILARGRTPAPSPAPLPECTLWPYFCARFMRPAPCRAANAWSGPSFSGPWLGAGGLVSHHIVPAPIRESGPAPRKSVWAVWDSGPLSPSVRRFRNWEKRGGKGCPHPVSGPCRLLSFQWYLLSWLVATGVEESSREDVRPGQRKGWGRGGA